jgi:hypothetical protein
MEAHKQCVRQKQIQFYPNQSKHSKAKQSNQAMVVIQARRNIYLHDHELVSYTSTNNKQRQPYPSKQHQQRQRID